MKVEDFIHKNKRITMKNNKYLKPASMIALLTMGTCTWADNKAAVVEKTQQEIDAINQSQQGLEIKTHADGSRSVDLKGRFQMYSMAHMVDGQIVYSCQDHEHHAINTKDLLENKTAIERGVQ